MRDDNQIHGPGYYPRAPNRRIDPAIRQRAKAANFGAPAGYPTRVDMRAWAEACRAWRDAQDDIMLVTDLFGVER